MQAMTWKALFALIPVAGWMAFSAGRPAEIPFEKHTIDLGAAESVTFADVNNDGKVDIVSGEFWYEGPKWVKHRFRELDYTNNYIDNFSDLAIDVNGDGKVDIAGCAWFGKWVAWWENNGKTSGEWKRHAIDAGANVEFCFLVDLDNDGKARELLPQFGGLKDPLAYYEIRNGEYVKRVVSNQSYGHGIGVGDINGDGRNDILTPKGWLEAPDWKFHGEWDLGATGFLYAADINGDGKMDVVTSMAHDYGIFWLENQGGGKWAKRMIDDSWSQSHAMTFVDLNGDGQKDLLTGKRYMAHNGRDPGEKEPLGIYWYEYRKGADGKVEWTRHVIDYSTRTGAGMQIPVRDIDGDGDPDFVVAGKSGLYLFENLTRKR